jgi:glycosyltransferase involved in cell wall biosynthesis
MMNVLHLATEKTWRGGEAQVLYLCNGLKSHGCGVVLASDEQSELKKRAHAKGIDVRGIRIRGEFNLLVVWKVARMLRECGSEILHMHDAHAVGIGVLASKCVRNVCTVATRRVSFPLKNKWKYLSLDHIIAVSEGVKASLIRGGIGADRISVVHSGIDISRFDRVEHRNSIREEFGWYEDTCIVGTSAALEEHKGLNYLCDAARIVIDSNPNVRFVIVGDGSMRDTLAGQVKRLGLLDAVKFTGFQKDPLPLIAQMNVCVLPSVRGEGSPAFVKEAMALSKPVVATNTAGIREIIEHGVTGILVQPRDPHDLARGLLDLMGEKRMMGEMGRSARLRVMEKFGIEKMVDGTVQQYRILTGREI